MDIKILDSHLREHLETNAKAHDIAKVLSLTSASIESVMPFGEDFAYKIEITTNRPDMVSVRGIAREAATVLPQFGYSAKLLPIKNKKHAIKEGVRATIQIKNDPKLVKRICAVILEVNKGESPKYIKERLETAGIRSLNNLIDVTNYAMIEMGHPCHVFDYDRLTTKKLIIRESKKGEKLITLDKKEHTLLGGDIVADNGEGEIVDLLGVMGTENSVVTDSTKHILFFLDNNDPWKIRKTSMGLAIRTEAAALNEKGVDPELAMETLLRGIDLYAEVADAKIISEIIDIYPVKNKPTTVTIAAEKITQLIGIPITAKNSAEILESLGFLVKIAKDTLTVTPPSWRIDDVTTQEDIVEEVARVYGYHNIPSVLPTFEHAQYYHQDKDIFYWEQKIKNALKFWGFTETYTYSLVGEELLTEPAEKVITLRNPLDADHVHMRTSLIPSFKIVLTENKSEEHLALFELANVYKKRKNDLPHEILTLSILMKGNAFDGKPVNFFHLKGILEQLAREMGIANLKFYEHLEDKIGAYINIGDRELGEIVITDDGVVAEVNFNLLASYANAKKTYTPIAKYPPVIEDITFVIDPIAKTADVIDAIKKQSTLIQEVSLLDSFEDSRTFHIVYQSEERNLITADIEEIRNKIIDHMSEKFGTKVK